MAGVAEHFSPLPARRLINNSWPFLSFRAGRDTAPCACFIVKGGGRSREGKRGTGARPALAPRHILRKKEEKRGTHSNPVAPVTLIVAQLQKFRWRSPKTAGPRFPPLWAAGQSHRRGRGGGEGKKRKNTPARPQTGEGGGRNLSSKPFQWSRKREG